MMTRLREAKAFEHVVESAAGPNLFAVMVEKWSPAARAAAAAARKARGGSRNWRQVARQTYINQPGVPKALVRSGGAAGDDPAVKRAGKLGRAAAGTGPFTPSPGNAAGSRYRATFGRALDKSIARRKKRFAFTV